MGGKERDIQYYQKIAAKATVFNTQTGEGDKSVVKGIKLSSRRVAKIVLSQDPSNINAIRLLKWTKDKKSLEPNIEDYMKTYKAAGFWTFSL